MGETRVVVESDQPEASFDLTRLELPQEIVQAVPHALEFAGHASRDVQDEDEVHGPHILGHEDRLGALLSHPPFGEQGQQQPADKPGEAEDQPLWRACEQ